MPGHAQKHRPTDTLANIQPRLLRPHRLGARSGAAVGKRKILLNNFQQNIQQTEAFDFSSTQTST